MAAPASDTGTCRCCDSDEIEELAGPVQVRVLVEDALAGAVEKLAGLEVPRHEIVQLIDDPQQAVDAIFAFYEQRGFELSAVEREVLLNL